MEQRPLRVKLLDEKARAPSRGTAGAAGYDLYACEGATIGARAGPVGVQTRIAVEIPPGYYGRIACRSSLAALGIDVLGGVIDADYRGPVTVILINHHASVDYTFRAGDRVA